MNSFKTKTSHYTLMNGKAVAGIVITPSAGSWDVVVAWEWPGQADQGFFALIELTVDINAYPLPQIVDHVADYGSDKTHLKKYRDLFPNLF